MEDEAVQYAIAHGVVVVASAGNNAQTSNLTSFPAAYPGVIAVGATDQAGHRAAFSTREWDTSVAAPGVNIILARPGGGYRSGDGTSPAAAFVSGVCALIRAKYPRLSPAQVRDVLEHSAAGQPSGSYTAELGWGEVQPAAALRLAASLQAQPADPRPAAYRTRYFGDGTVPSVGFGAATRPLYLGFLIPAGGALLVGAVLLATLRPRRPTMM
jgi:subtilisin family serine protease